MDTTKTMVLAAVVSLFGLPALATDCSDQGNLAGDWLVGGDSSSCTVNVRPQGLLRGSCRTVGFNPATGQPTLEIYTIRGRLTLRPDCGIQGSILPEVGDRFGIEGRVWATDPTGMNPDAGIFLSTRRNAPTGGFMSRALP